MKEAQGHIKNSRNQLVAMRRSVRHGESVEEEDIEYALQEIQSALEGFNPTRVRLKPYPTCGDGSDAPASTPRGSV
jgi:hypothetical protein